MSDTDTRAENRRVQTSNQPNYAGITPASKPPTEYTYAERRSEILQQIQDLGHPAAINQTELGDRYGVSQQQISRDLDRLEEYVRGELGARRDLEIGSVLQRCMTGALEEGEWNTARKAAESYNEYLETRLDTLEFRDRIQRLEKVAERDS